MKKNNIPFEEMDPIARTAMENLKLSAKKADVFAKQARALQHNLALRKKQMQERIAQQDSIKEPSENQ